MLKSSALIILLAVSLINCQFVYNYEEEGTDGPQTETQQNNPSIYPYNPPAATNQQFLRPSRSQSEELGQTGRSRTRIRVRSRNYQMEPDHTETQPETQPETNQHALRQQRRQERKKQRQSENIYVPPIQSPRVYSPSVFENIRLGEAPNGVYVPHDSFLNVLKNPSRRTNEIVPQTNNYVQPAVSYVSNEPQQTFFVQPPSYESTRQPNSVSPITRSQSVIPPPAQAREHRGRSPSTQARAVGTSRQTHQKSHVQPIREIPTVDIDIYRESPDARQPAQVMPRVEYSAVAAQQETRPHQNRRRTVTRYQESTPARVYSPSIFQNIPLGEAPSGIYVPDDSLLNVLRNPSAGRQVISRANRREPLQVPAQPTYNQVDDQNDYLPEVIEEEQYQPPPPPSPSRRQSSQRSRQTNSLRQSGHRRYEPEERDDTKPVQSFSQRRNQQRSDNFDDSLRHQPPRQQTQSQRRQQDAVVPRPQPQPSSSNRGQASREAKLAIAELPLDTDDDGIPGEAGVNYPTLHVIPKTAFSCSQQEHNGYYADLETSCQVVHLCQSGGVQDSFLCPNGTIWNQEKFSCQWWYKVNCSDSPKFYIKNDELYKVPEKKEKKRN